MLHGCHNRQHVSSETRAFEIREAFLTYAGPFNRRGVPRLRPFREHARMSGRHPIRDPTSTKPIRRVEMKNKHTLEVGEEMTGEAAKDSGVTIETAMLCRAQAKNTIATVTDRLWEINNILIALGSANFLKPELLNLSHVGTGRLDFKIHEQDEVWKSVDFPNLSDIKFLVGSLETARNNLTKAEERLAELGTPI